MGAEVITIPRLSIEDEIGRGGRNAVYRATCEGRPVAVKVPLSEAALDGRDGSLQSRREAAYLACLQHTGLPEVLSSGEVEGRPYLVMELVQGPTLAKVLAERGPIGEEEIRGIAVSLGRTLSEVHRRGFVHRDIKPGNILLCDSGEIKLLDFGFATRALEDQEQVAGTFLYSAPEQTGMLKRPLDGRSDLYSLGVVLYECAAGSPPFRSHDAAELIRRHAVEAPEALSIRSPQLSEATAAVIEKLLSKDPDDRYRSGEALLRALERQTDAQASTAEPAPELPGREAELAEIDSIWREVQQGRGRVVLIEGEAGSGKSLFLEHVLGQAGRQGAPVLYGRNSEADRAPFSALREAIEGFLEEVSLRPTAKRAQAEEQIRIAAGDYAPLLRRFSPCVDALLPDAPPLETSEAPGQFYDAIAAFVAGLAEAAGGAVLAVDDVGLLDDASAQVLRRVAARIEHVPILLLAAAREAGGRQTPTDVFGLDPGDECVRAVRLPAFDEQGVRRLVSLHLGDRPVPDALIRRLVSRSQGSPLAVVEHLRATLDAGLLVPSWDGWQVDEEGLERLDLPDSVLELASARLEGIGKKSREVLRLTAVVGMGYRVEELFAVCEATEEQVGAALNEGVSRQLVEPAGNGGYRFVHARVRDALLAELREEELPGIHQSIAESLDRLGRTDRVYELAHHYWMGRREKNPMRVVETSREAGWKAADAYAYAQAHGYLLQAALMREEMGLAPDTEIEEKLGDLCEVLGRIDDGLEHLRTALSATSDAVARGRIRAKIGWLHVTVFKPGEALQEVEQALAELGHSYPAGALRQVLSALGHWIRGLVAVHLRVVSRLPDVRDRELYAVLEKLMIVAGYVGFFESDTMLLLQTTMRFFDYAHRTGDTRSLARAYSDYSNVLASVGMGKTAEKYNQRAIELASQRLDRTAMGFCLHMQSFARQFSGRPLDAETLELRCVREYEQWLDSWTFAGASAHLIWSFFMRGKVREAYAWIVRILENGRIVQAGTKHISGASLASPSCAILGRRAEAAQYLSDWSDTAAAHPEGRFFRMQYVVDLLLYNLETDNPGRALDDAIEVVDEMHLSPGSVPVMNKTYYLLRCYARLAQARASDGEERERRVRQLEGALKELAAAGNHPLIGVHRLITGAGLLALRRNPKRALRLLDRAEREALRWDNAWALFETSRQRAFIHSEAGNETACLREALFAMSIARRHGWTSRAQQIRAAFPVEEVSESSHHSSLASSGGSNIHLKRYLDALLQVSLASSQVLDPQKQACATLDELVRLLAAERAFLFVPGEDGSPVPAAARDSSGHDIEDLQSASYTIVRAVMTQKEAVVISGLEDQANLGSESIVVQGLRSIMAAPLLLQERLVGVVYLDSRIARGIFSQDDVKILLALANHIAIGLETARAAQLQVRFEAETQKRELSEMLRDASTALTSTLDLPQILRHFLEALSRIAAFDQALVFQPAGDGELELAAVWREADHISVGERVDATLPVLARIARSNGVLRCDDRQALAVCHAERLFPQAVTLVGIPLPVKDELVGMLLLGSERADVFTTEAIDLVLTLCGQAAVAIQNAHLFGEIQRLATKDDLTQLYNRRFFFEMGNQEFARARRYSKPLAAILFDVDHFKTFNDTWGHAMGDEVLRRIAGISRQSIRETDIIARYGGEEFVLLLPESDLSAGMKLAERIRTAIAGLRVPVGNDELQVTVSLGVAERTEDTESLQDMLHRADMALYDAKANGRDRVEAADQPVRLQGVERPAAG